MLRTLNIFLILTSVISISVKAQKDAPYKLIAFIKGDVVDFTVDNLDNVYVLTSTDQLKKYNANGDSVAVFNNVKKFGKVSTIDVSNPLKVLLYYKDFSTIVMLDRLLTVRNTIDLRQQNIFQVNAIGQSYDNNIWLYDEGDSKLKKISDEGKTLLETADFRLLFDEAPHVKNIYDQDGFVYLYDPRQTVFVFDYYGALRNKILISGWQDFKVAGKFIFGINNDTLHRYEINTFRLDEEKLPVPLKNSLKLNFTSSRLYALKKDLLEIYTLR
jgi:glutaredoxin-related protein